MERKHRLPGACSAGCSAIAWETADGRHLFGRNFDYKLVADGVLPEMPLTTCVAAVSAGIVGEEPMLDLCYEEDSHAQVDLNCVMTGEGNLVELQGTGEGRPFTVDEQRALVDLCAKGIKELQAIQRQVLGG